MKGQNSIIPQLILAIRILCIIIFFLLGIIGYLLIYFEKKEKPQFYCGVVNTSQTINWCGTSSSSSRRGEKLFKANCASCHKMDKKMIGPALNRTRYRVPSEQWLDTLIINENSLILAQDSYLIALRKEYKSLIYTHRFHFTEEELNEIKSVFLTK